MLFKDPHTTHLGSDASVFIALKRFFTLALVLISLTGYSQKIHTYKDDNIYFNSFVNRDKVEVDYIKDGKAQKAIIDFRSVTCSQPNKQGVVETYYPTGLKTIVVRTTTKNPNVVFEIKEI